MRISKTKNLLFFLVMVTTLVMYIPVIYNSGLYGILRYFLFVLMAGVVIMTFKWSTLISHGFTRSIGAIFLFIIIEFLLFYAFQLNYVAGDFVQIFIVLMMIMAGTNSSLDEKAFLKLCSFYSIGTIAIGIIAVSSYLGAFSVAINAYAIEGKNQVGAIVAFGTGIAFYLSQTLNKSKKKNYFLIVSIVGIALSLVIRCRTATVGLMLFVLYMLAHNWTAKQKMIFAFFAIVLYIGFFNRVNEFLADVFLGDKDIEVSVDQADFLNQVSTSRFERNEMAFLFLREHLFFGELTDLSGIPLIHNYVILRLTRYGLLSLPLLIVYFIFVVKCIKSLLKGNLRLFNMGWILLIIPLFCSLLEPSAPFGPGTVQLMPYFLCGIALKNESRNVI